MVALLQRYNSKIVGLVEAAHILKENQSAPQSRSSLAGSTRENQPEYSSLRKSPQNGVRDTLFKAQEEISGTLRQSVNQLHQSNYNDIATQLQLQMDKNNELADKVDWLNKHLHSLSLAANEELARCLYSIEGAIKIDNVNNPNLTLVKADLNRLRSRFQGAFGKAPLSVTEHVENKDLRGEYDKQKGYWEDQIRQHQETFEREIVILKAELQREQDLHIQTKRRLEEKNIELKHQAELQAAQHLRESSAQQNKIERLETDLNSAQDSVDNLQRKLRDVENATQEREQTIRSYAIQISEFESKASLQENESYQLETDLGNSRRENLLLNQKLDEANRVLRDMQRRIDIIEERAGKVDTDKNQLISEFAEKRREYERERNQIEREAEEAREELKKHMQKTELATKDMKESYNRLIEDYTRQIDQLRAAHEEYRNEKEADLRGKKEDLRQLNLKVQTLEEVSSTQETAVKRRDEKINSLMQEKSHVHERNSDLERQLVELVSLREKNKKTLDAIAEAKSEHDSLKLENQTLTHDKERLEARLTKLEKEVDDRRSENERFRQSARNAESKQSDIQTEFQTLKIQLDAERQNVIKKEKEIK